VEAIRIDAADQFDPQSDVRDSGLTLAHRVNEALARSADTQVVVSFKGVRGAASSFFNVFLHHVAQWSGPTVLTSRVSFDFGSQPQRIVFDRSFHAVLAELASKRN
jgi:hypothetical protein